MSVTAKWDNEARTTILLTFAVPWNWDAFEGAREEITLMMNSVSHEIDLIIDVRAAGEIPDDAIRWLRRSYSGEALKLRRYILVGAPDSIREMFAVADRYYTALGGFLQFAFVDTLEDARTLPVDVDTEP